MKVGEIMTLEVQTIGPEAGVQEAAEAMRDLDLGMLPVLERGSLLGVLTDRDLAVRFVAAGLDFSGTKVADVMSREICSVYEEQDAAEAAGLMEERRVRRAPVLSRDGKLVGVVSLADFARLDPSPRRAARPAPAAARLDGAGADVAAANGLIRDELAAVETYKVALERFRGAAAAAELRRLEDDHERAAAILQEQVAERGVEPATSSGARGGWARLIEGAASLFGDKAALKVLKEGEEHGIRDYELALEDGGLSSSLRALIQTELLPQAKSHLSVLDRFLAGRTPPHGMSYNADQGYGPAGSGRGVA